jgi:hypothetical protein
VEQKINMKNKRIYFNVLPKPKSLDEIFISPNHEFVHQFDLGTIEKDRWNPNTRQTETVTVPYNLAEKFKDFVGTLSSEAFAGSSSWEVRSFVDNETLQEATRKEMPWFEKDEKRLPMICFKNF